MQQRNLQKQKIPFHDGTEYNLMTGDKDPKFQLLNENLNHISDCKGKFRSSSCGGKGKGFKGLAAAMSRQLRNLYIKTPLLRRLFSGELGNEYEKPSLPTLLLFRTFPRRCIYMHYFCIQVDAFEESSFTFIRLKLRPQINFTDGLHFQLILKLLFKETGRTHFVYRACNGAFYQLKWMSFENTL